MTARLRRNRRRSMKQRVHRIRRRPRLPSRQNNHRSGYGRSRCRTVQRRRTLDALHLGDNPFRCNVRFGEIDAPRDCFVHQRVEARSISDASLVTPLILNGTKQDHERSFNAGNKQMGDHDAEPRSMRSALTRRRRVSSRKSRALGMESPRAQRATVVESTPSLRAISDLLCISRREVRAIRSVTIPYTRRIYRRKSRGRPQESKNRTSVRFTGRLYRAMLGTESL